MPWYVTQSNECPGNKPYAVKKKDGKLVACHETKAQAEKQLRALYASEGKK